jgi:S1-C subfamily serine protease
MRFPLFNQVALARDIPEDGLKKGDIATVVEHHPVSSGEDGYSLEVFNALGETIVVTVVSESAMEPLREDQVFSVRLLARNL